MKIRYIVSMGGATATFPAFEKDYKGDYVFYNLEDYEAVRLIDAEMCVAKNEKDYTKAKENYEALKAENERKKIIAEKINKLGEMKEKRDSLKIELDELEKEINLIENPMGINSEKSLLEKYNENRNIVDELNEDDLKNLCKDLNIEFTKEDEIREHLKTLEPLKD